MMPKRKYVLVRQSMQSFIEPLPTDKLIWLAKAALDEIALRTAAAERSAKLAAPKAREFQQHGRTLR
jgi:hypothetical protein